MIAPYVYDTGALIALDRNQRAAWARHQVALTDERRVIVPTVALAQVWRNSRTQQTLHRLLRSCELHPLDDGLARRAGELCGRSRTGDVVDAAVVAIASSQAPAIVWTSDPDDLDLLTAALDPPIPGQHTGLLIRRV